MPLTSVALYLFSRRIPDDHSGLDLLLHKLHELQHYARDHERVVHDEEPENMYE